MRTKLLSLTLMGLASASLLSACADDGDAGEVVTTTDAARIVRSDAGALTPPSSAAPEQVVRDYLRGRGVAVDQLALAARRPTQLGVTHVVLEQRLGGLRVHGAYVKAAIDVQGQLIQVIDATVPARGPLAAAAVTEQGALAAALAAVGYEGEATPRLRTEAGKGVYAAGAAFHRPPTVEAVAYVDAAGAARQGFLVETWTVRGNLLDHTLVGDDGAVLASERRTNHDSYNVFVEDPLKGAQAVVAGPGAGNAQSPSGWLGAGAQTTINITGNNAHAYLDADNNNAADAGGTAVTTGSFTRAVDFTAQPSTANNKEVAAQNLFYLNNVVHDVLYRHGFDEASGNFQINNFGKGGAGNDPVNAEAQDGSGTDNANMSTPTDGSSPRMQMYLWSSKAPSAEVVVSAVAYGAYPSSFGTALTTTGVTYPLASLAVDGCNKLASGSLTGKTAIIDRGTCNFTVKVLNAQNAGAKAVVLVNNVATAAFAPGGTESRIKIPSAMVSQADGATLRTKAGLSSALRKKAVAPIMLDGDLDSDIVFHEYGHGLTWRMIGGMSGKLAGAIGEGASDVNAFLIDGDDIMGEYAWGSPEGIRRYPYEGYPLTYRSVTGAEVHDDGEIYAGAMWKVRGNYLAAGLTVDDVFDDFVQGMHYTPATPAYESMRDGMLSAIAARGGTTAAARKCAVWRGFAAQGIGVGAKGTISASGTLTVTESFALPTECP